MFKQHKLVLMGKNNMAQSWVGGEGVWIWEELVDGVNTLKAQNMKNKILNSKPIVRTG